MNSRLVRFYLDSIVSKVRGGYFSMSKSYVETTPVANKPEDTTKIVHLVNETLNVKKENPEADTTALEAEIDQLVYQLYELTPEEIEIVENSVK